MTEHTPMSRPYGDPSSYHPKGPAPANLADILERVLDKGIVIAGDIRVNLLDIELLTIRIRLLVVSVDKAMEMGIDWWRNDPMLNATQEDLTNENRALRQRIRELEAGAGPNGHQPGARQKQQQEQQQEEERAGG